MEQIKNEIVSIHTPQVSGAMEIDATHAQNTNQNYHQLPLDISSLIHDLKHEIATFVIETHTLLQRQSPPMMQHNNLPSKTWVSYEPVWVFLVTSDFER